MVSDCTGHDHSHIAYHSPFTPTSKSGMDKGNRNSGQLRFTTTALFGKLDVTPFETYSSPVCKSVSMAGWEVWRLSRSGCSVRNELISLCPIALLGWCLRGLLLHRIGPSSSIIVTRHVCMDEAMLGIPIWLMFRGFEAKPGNNNQTNGSVRSISAVDVEAYIFLDK